MHIRVVDNATGDFTPHGGVTIAYTVEEITSSICAVYVKCRPDELFCYKTGREEALKKLQHGPVGEINVMELDHPISHVLADWIATDVWPNGPQCRDMGYAIDVEQDDKGRWISDFYPAQSQIEFIPEDHRDPNYAEDRYAG